VQENEPSRVKSLISQAELLDSISHDQEDIDACNVYNDFVSRASYIYVYDKWLYVLAHCTHVHIWRIQLRYAPHVGTVKAEQSSLGLKGDAK